MGSMTPSTPPRLTLIGNVALWRAARRGLGIGDGAVLMVLRPVPVVLPGRWPPLQAHWTGMRRVRPVCGGQGASRRLLPGGQSGLPAAILARERGGAWPCVALSLDLRMRGSCVALCGWTVMIASGLLPVLLPDDLDLVSIGL
jgi:hypothetical protein